MSVQNGDKANAGVFNAAFVSKTADNEVTAVIALDNDSDPDSGATIDNIQQAMNESMNTIGMTGIDDATRKNYSSQNYVANGDSHKTAIGKIDTQLKTTTDALLPAVSDSRATPADITAGGGITVGTDARMTKFIQGSGAAVTISANPQIAAGVSIGQELTLIGRDDTKTVTLSNGTGLSLNGDITLAEDDMIRLIWDGTNWSELCRRH